MQPSSNLNAHLASQRRCQKCAEHILLMQRDAYLFFEPIIAAANETNKNRATHGNGFFEAPKNRTPFNREVRFANR